MGFGRLLAALGAIATLAAAPSAPSVEGRWLTQGKHGIVEIYRCGGGDTLCGRLAWVRLEPGDPNRDGVDLHNPVPERRNRSLCGLVFMTGFRPAGPDVWEDGTLYDTETGKSYRGALTLQADGTLRVRGYIGISLFGGSNVWTRYSDPVPPHCPDR